MCVCVCVCKYVCMYMYIYIYIYSIFLLQSGAKINISDASCPERIVTVTGTTDQIFKAFTMICKKFEEVCSTIVFMEYCDVAHDDGYDDDHDDGDDDDDHLCLVMLMFMIVDDGCSLN